MDPVYTGSGAYQSTLYYYVLGGRLIGSNDGTNITFYLTDALGSVLSSFSNTVNAAVVKANQLFGPYGVQRYSGGTINTARGFTGQYTDSLTGLDYYNARYYDPAVGVFLSADIAQGNAQGMNPYAYVNGNPETKSDPTGRMITGYGGGSDGSNGELSNSGDVDPITKIGQAVRQKARTDLAATRNGIRSSVQQASQKLSGAALNQYIAYLLAMEIEGYRDNGANNRNGYKNGPYADGYWYITGPENLFINGGFLTDAPQFGYNTKGGGPMNQDHAEYQLLLKFIHLFNEGAAAAIKAIVSNIPGFENGLCGCLGELGFTFHVVVFVQRTPCGRCSNEFAGFADQIESQVVMNDMPVDLTVWRSANQDFNKVTAPDGSQVYRVYYPGTVESMGDVIQVYPN